MENQNPLRQAIARTIRNSREVAKERAPRASVSDRNKLALGIARHALERAWITYPRPTFIDRLNG